MANRRMGGMGGGLRGNNRPFSQQQPFQGGNVSPWQGNMPSNNSMNQGLLSQLTSNPQQLALALTNLLQPQQQQMNNPPSLLSLNTSPAFSNQDRDFNRFGNRGRDFRRHEPYNKNRNGGNWRSMDTNRNRNPSNNRNNQNNRDSKRSPAFKDQRNKKVDQRKNDKTEKKEDDKKVKKDNDDADVTVEDGNDESQRETKRDWKDEKNNSEEKKEDSDEEDSKKDTKNREGVYFDVPAKFLKCFVCNKEMWDGESMQKHIRGRAHKQMLSSLEESIHITVNILRENMRLAEEKKAIEWNRMQRLKKYNKFNEPESHCNMCDLKFMGKIIAHRKTEGHQRLKRFLHPNCEICDKEFPSRMEWVEHRLTPDHLRKLNKTLTEKVGGADGDMVVIEEEVDLEHLLDEQLEMEVDNPILELTDDLSGLQNLIPAYKRDRAVSTLSLRPFTGFLCELCNRSFENEQLAQDHLKTMKHYYAFIEAARAQYQQQLKKEKKVNKEKKEDSLNQTQEESQMEEEAEGEKEMYDPEEACNEEEETEESDWKMDESAGDGDPSVIDTSSKSAVIEVEDEEEEAAPKKVEKVVEPPKTPLKAVTIPISQVRQTRGGAVKNGAGPKSKKESEASQVQKSISAAPSLSTFRIPKKK